MSWSIKKIEYKMYAVQLYWASITNIVYVLLNAYLTHWYRNTQFMHYKMNTIFSICPSKHQAESISIRDSRSTVQQTWDGHFGEVFHHTWEPGGFNLGCWCWFVVPHSSIVLTEFLSFFFGGLNLPKLGVRAMVNILANFAYLYPKNSS